MPHARRIPLLILAAWLSSISIASAAAAESHVRAKIFADVSAAEPGRPFVVGVMLDIDPGWHVYWINPGDSGTATSVEFTLPDGWRAGEIQFPIPIKFNQAGDVVGYGYEKQLMLLATISPSEQAKIGQTLTVSAKVSWLVCKDICIPGSEKLELKLPVAASATRANADAFAPWLARIPVPAKDAKGIESLAVEGEIFADGSPAPFVIDVRTHQPWKDAQWFPAATDPALSVEDIHVQSDADHVGVAYRLRVLSGQKLSTKTMKSVLAYTDESGQRRGVVVDVPLKLEGQSQ